MIFLQCDVNFSYIFCILVVKISAHTTINTMITTITQMERNLMRYKFGDKSIFLDRWCLKSSNVCNGLYFKQYSLIILAFINSKHSSIMGKPC